MSDAVHWDDHYRRGKPPWESSGGPSTELGRVLAEQRISPQRVFELGCGSGMNAVWLAQQGFDVTGVDLSPLALERARRRAAEAGVTIRFEQDDVLALKHEYEPFPFFFDRGCYHAVRRIDSAAYVRTLQRIAAPGALGLILTGNARSTHKPGEGPPVVSEAELRSELEPAFEIVRLREFRFDGDEPTPFLAWSCLLRKSE